MVVTALAWALVAPTQAYAADDQIDSFTINYEMQSSGALKVMETVVRGSSTFGSAIPTRPFRTYCDLYHLLSGDRRDALL
jgi:hypothetical protein